MKKWISIIGVILVVVFVSGCTAQSSAKTYSGNNISFQYPGNWSTDYNSSLQNFGSEGDVLVKLGKNDSGMGVAKANIGSSNLSAATMASEFETLIQSKYQIISNKTVIVDGINATQIVMKDNSNGDYGSLTFLNKNNSIYIIMISTPDNNQQTINMILNSFKFQ